MNPGDSSTCIVLYISNRTMHLEHASAQWDLSHRSFTPPAPQGPQGPQGRLPWQHSPRVLVSGTEGAVLKTCLHFYGWDSNHQKLGWFVTLLYPHYIVTTKMNQKD